MNIFTKIAQWADNHNPKWLALVRLLLGAAILLRGVIFLDNSIELGKLVNATGFSNAELITGLLPWIHIASGFLLIIGLFCRFVAMVQIATIVASMIFLYTPSPMFTTQMNVVYCLINILLLSVFVVEGSGTLSLGGYFKEQASA